MLSVYRHLAIQRPCDAVYLKRLRVFPVSRDGGYDAAIRNIAVVYPVDWILHFQLKRAVSFFRDLAGNCVRKAPKSLRLKFFFVFAVQNRSHSVTHLGTISILVTVEGILISFTPGRSSGHSVTSIKELRLFFPLYASFSSQSMSI